MMLFLLDILFPKRMCQIFQKTGTVAKALRPGIFGFKCMQKLNNISKDWHCLDTLRWYNLKTKAYALK